MKRGFDSSELRLRLGLMLMGRKRYKQAEVEFRKSVELNPRNAIALRQLGSILMHFKKPDEAIKVLQKAVALAPERWRPQYNLGLAALNQKKHDVAAKAFEAVVTTQAKDLPAMLKLKAQLSLGVALLYLNQVSKATTHLRSALRKKRALMGYLPGHFDPLVQAKLLKSAAALLRELIRVRPKKVYRKNLKIILARIKRGEGK
jgi:tetratricopeptide (TPR) repeat protein